MDSDDFVGSIVQSMQDLTSLYAKGESGGTYLGSKLDDMGLNVAQRQYVLALIRLAVGEATHSLISGIEGKVTMGGQEHTYKLQNEFGVELTGELSDLLYDELEGDDVLDTAILSQAFRFKDLADL